jgi:hypothetical protein
MLETFRNQLKNSKCCKNYQISSEFQEKNFLELSRPSLSISTSLRLLFFITIFLRAEEKLARIFE